MKQHDFPVVNACFMLESRSSLHVPAVIPTYAAWHYLSNLIVRNPGDLLNHTRRVLHCRQPALKQFLPGALYDLFLVLNDAGFALRTRVFRSVLPDLPDDHGEYFERWLMDGRQPGVEDIPFKGSLLPALELSEPRTEILSHK